MYWCRRLNSLLVCAFPACFMLFRPFSGERSPRIMAENPTDYPPHMGHKPQTCCSAGDNEIVLVLSCEQKNHPVLSLNNT